MSRKRGARGQLNPQLAEQLEAADEREDTAGAGGFARASVDKLRQRRKIRLRKRGSAAANTPKTNPFSGFSGLAGAAGTGGGGGPPAKAQPSFAAATQPKPGTVDAAATSGERSTYYKKVKALNASFRTWVEEQARENSLSDWSVGVQEYLDYMQSLTAKHGGPDASTPPSGGADAAQPSKSSRASDAGSSASASGLAFWNIGTTGASASPSAGFSFGGPSKSVEEKEKAMPSSGIGFSFDAGASGIGSAATGASTSTGAAFSFSGAGKGSEDKEKGTSGAASGFSFGSSADFSFGTGGSDKDRDKDAGKPGFGFGSDFNFGGGSNTATGAGTGTSGGGGDGEDEASSLAKEQEMCATLERAKDEDGTALVYEVRAKLLLLPSKGKEEEDPAWKDFGVGELRVKTRDGRAFAQMCNGVGKTVLNTALYPELAVERQGKKGVAFVTANAGDGPARVLLRVSTPAAADELRGKLDQYKQPA